MNIMLKIHRSNDKYIMFLSHMQVSNPVSALL